MSRLSIVFVAGVLAAVVPIAPSRADTATLTSSYQAQGTWWEVSEGRTYWSGTFWVFSFNEAGKGFGHQMAWNCPATGVVADGIAHFKGFCVETDTDGDKLFSSWEAEAPVDEALTGHEIYEGGTGKYAGVTGEHDFACYAVGSNEQGYCRQQVTYTLP